MTLLSKFDVKFDGKTPNAAALQKAFDSGEPVLEVDAGLCLIEGPVVIKNTILIVGQGFSSRPTTTPTVGSVFVCKFTPNVGSSVFSIEAENVCFRDLEICGDCAPPTTSDWSPSPSPSAILAETQPYTLAGGSDCELSNVMIRGLSSGFVMRGGGRAEITKLFGQTWGPLVDIDGCYDVMRINGLHSWTFWSQDAIAQAWMLANSTASRWGRVDNPNIINFFSFGAKVGLHFTDSSAIPAGGMSRGQFANIGIDYCRYGLLADGKINNHEADFSNFYVNHAPTTGAVVPADGSRSIYLPGSITHTFNFSNLDLSGSAYEAIRIESASKSKIANGRIRSYNQASQLNTAAPAVYLGSGASLQRALLEIDSGNGNGAPPFEGPGMWW